MDLNLENITFVIVTYKSEKVIYDCLNSLPKQSYKIIIENSENLNLKKDLESKYENINVFLNVNCGYGASNNIGIKKAKTQFVFILNPDTKFREDTFSNLIKSSYEISEFAIISPLHSNFKYPNFIVKNNYKNLKNDIMQVDEVDGFSMLINKHNFKDDQYFDENFFLYLENNDLCLKVKKMGSKIYIIKNSIIDHKGSSSSDDHFSNEIEYLKNWHWMWSKFYFNKKHYGYFYSFLRISGNLFSAAAKFIMYFLLNNRKKYFYKARLSGCINGLMLKKSWYRAKI